MHTALRPMCLVLLIVLAFASASLYACSCWVYRGPRSDVLRHLTISSSEIYLLQAAAVQTIEQNNSNDWFFGPLQHASFRVLDVFKTQTPKTIATGMHLKSEYLASGADCGREVVLAQKELLFQHTPKSIRFGLCDLTKGYQEGDRKIISQMLQAKPSQAPPANWTVIQGGELPASARIMATQNAPSEALELLLWGEHIRPSQQVKDMQQCPQRLQIVGSEVSGRWRLSVRNRGSKTLNTTLYIQGPNGESELPLPDFSRQSKWVEKNSLSKFDSPFETWFSFTHIRFKHIQGCLVSSSGVLYEKGAFSPRLMHVIGSASKPFSYFDSYWYEGSVDGMEHGKLPIDGNYTNVDCYGKDRYSRSCLRDLVNSIVVGIPIPMPE